jgi:hypothetical protein
MSEAIKSIIDNAFSDKPAGVVTSVNVALAEKVTAAIEDLRSEIAKRTFHPSPTVK